MIRFATIVNIVSRPPPARAYVSASDNRYHHRHVLMKSRIVSTTGDWRFGCLEASGHGADVDGTLFQPLNSLPIFQSAEACYNFIALLNYKRGEHTRLICVPR